jgi:hypothetical protein
VEGNPYQIWDANDMQAIGADSNYWDAHFVLCADIDLGAYTGTSFNVIGRYPTPSTPFTGVFDGNGHTISNFTYDSNELSGVGLFGYISGVSVGPAEVKDLGLVDPNVRAHNQSYVGALVGYLNAGTVSGCYVQGGNVSGYSDVGGLVGSGYHSTIVDCNAEGVVSGHISTGGLAGDGEDFSNCYSEGRVEGDESVGGLVGECGRVSNSYSTATVLGNIRVGGLVGLNYQEVASSYSVGDVSGNDTVGGLVGYGSNILNSYSESSVVGDSNVGGLAGRGYTIVNSYSTGSVSGTTHVGGMVGRSSGTIISCFWDVNTSGQTSSAGGTGLTTAQMQDPNSYKYWGCGHVWTIEAGVDYPHLAWENQPGEIISEQLSDFISGSGTEGDPYLIYTADELNIIGLFVCEWDKHFELMADIDLIGFTGTSFNKIGALSRFPFTGVFDGNGYRILNFSYTGNAEIGLFGYVDDPNAEIKDLGLLNADVEAVSLDDIDIGSLVGYLWRGTVAGCYSEGGRVASVGRNLGGLVGRNREGIITGCYSTASVSGGAFPGGLVGSNSGTVMRCYSVGSVDGDYFVGGLIGEGSGWIYASFWDVEASGQSNMCGRDRFAGTGCDDGNGKTTAEMQTEITFTDAGWDFIGETINGPNDIWEICEGTNYPKFVWQELLGDFVCPDGVSLVDYSYLAGAWYAGPNDGNWDPNCDISDPNDNIIDERDLGVFVDNYLEGI